MDELLNCFQWRHHLSDLLDENLPKPILNKVQLHLSTCSSCEVSFQRYLQIVAAIRGQDKSRVPEALRNAPLSAVLPQITASQFSLSQWEKLPWYLRTSLETVGVVLLVLVGISSGPRLKTWYDNSVERKLSDFKLVNPWGDSSKDFSEDGIPPVDDHSQVAAHSAAESNLVAMADDDELSGENDGEDSRAGSSGKSQLWRFTLKTVSPDELRQQVIRTLTGLKIPEKTPGLGGMQVPGGIEFKILLPEGKVPEVKSALQKLAPAITENTKVIPGSETFTWFRVKSKKSIPEGKAQVIIWLSQPN